MSQSVCQILFCRLISIRLGSHGASATNIATTSLSDIAESMAHDDFEVPTISVVIEALECSEAPQDGYSELQRRALQALIGDGAAECLPSELVAIMKYVLVVARKDTGEGVLHDLATTMYRLSQDSWIRGCAEDLRLDMLVAQERVTEGFTTLEEELDELQPGIDQTLRMVQNKYCISAE